MVKKTAVKTALYLKQGLPKAWKTISYLALSWPKAFVTVVVFLILSYYPLGGLLTENIDKTTDYNLKTESEQQSLTVETMVFLINREVNENLWTANLPLFFPSYFLDNMPSYQKGIISALATAAGVINAETMCPEDSHEKVAIASAAELLKYPGNIWLFAPENRLKIAPSSASQYRKARKLLRDYNRLLPAGQCVWSRNASNMTKFLSTVERDLSSSVEKLESYVAEHSSDWMDKDADNLFYYNQGKMYAYMQLLKAWGTDFKDVLLDRNQYENWTKAVRALEDGMSISPLMVRNGKLDSGFANHIVVVGYYMLRAATLINQINHTMEGVSFNAD